MPLNHSFPYEENIPKYLKFLKTGLENYNKKSRKIILSLIMTVCALLSGAQTLLRHTWKYAELGRQVYPQRNWVDAERMIVNALRLEPANKSNYLLWSNLGIVRDRIGNTEGALQAFDIGLASAPRSTVLLANRAYTLMKTGRDKEALRRSRPRARLDSTLLVPRLSAPDCISCKTPLLKPGRTMQPLSPYILTAPGGHEGLGDVASLQGDNRKASEEYAREIAIADSENLRFKKILALIGAEDTNTAERGCTLPWGNFPAAADCIFCAECSIRENTRTRKRRIERKLALEYGADPDLVDAMLRSQKNDIAEILNRSEARSKFIYRWTFFSGGSLFLLTLQTLSPQVQRRHREHTHHPTLKSPTTIIMERLSIHIEYLLLRHDCVVVPGFGAFINARSEARVSTRSPARCIP